MNIISKSAVLGLMLGFFSISASASEFFFCLTTDAHSSPICKAFQQHDMELEIPNVVETFQLGPRDVITSMFFDKEHPVPALTKAQYCVAFDDNEKFPFCYHNQTKEKDPLAKFAGRIHVESLTKIYVKAVIPDSPKSYSSISQRIISPGLPPMWGGIPQQPTLPRGHCEVLGQVNILINGDWEPRWQWIWDARNRTEEECRAANWGCNRGLSCHRWVTD